MGTVAAYIRAIFNIFIDVGTFLIVMGVFVVAFAHAFFLQAWDEEMDPSRRGESVPVTRNRTYDCIHVPLRRLRHERLHHGVHEFDVHSVHGCGFLGPVEHAHRYTLSAPPYQHTWRSCSA